MINVSRHIHTYTHTYKLNKKKAIKFTKKASENRKKITQKLFFFLQLERKNNT